MRVMRLGVASLLLCGWLCNAAKPNVLYIIADDMRADIGPYHLAGAPAVTPNLDKLSESSLIFQRAYCQISVCAPSRMSFMHSRRPDTTQIWNFIDVVPNNTISTPRHFRDNGYLVLGLGKGFHQGNASASSLGCWNGANVWSPNADFPCYPYTGGSCPHGGEGGGHCVQKDSSIYDSHLATETVKYLKFAAENAKSTGQPFFVLSGYRKPHAPWQAPQRCYDMYNQSKIAVAKYKTISTGAPLVAWSNQLSVQLENGTGFRYDPTHAVPDWVAQDQRHAYYACISYVDEHVGMLMDTLTQSGVKDNTIVVFHADHGYALGEHGEWEKKSNWDLVVRVPLMVSVPWKLSKPAHTMAITELVDVGPTLAALALLPAMPGADGQDLSELFDNPKLTNLTQYAFHQYPACGQPKSWNHTREGCNNTPKNQFWAMGYSVRSNEWRYTRWLLWDAASLSAQWDNDDFTEELYDHHGDDSTSMDNYENENLADAQPKVTQQLFTVLRQFFDKK